MQERLEGFAERRDWNQFHTPKNLAMALAGEVGELVEILQWLTPEESASISNDPAEKKRVAEELADVAIYVLRLADKLGIDLEEAIEAKMALNEERYPVDLAKGNATKYNRRM